MKNLAEKAKADSDFMQRPEVQLQLKIVEAGILTNDYLIAHWAKKIRPTEQDIAVYLAAHPEYDLEKSWRKLKRFCSAPKPEKIFHSLLKSLAKTVRPNKGGLYENRPLGELWQEVEDAALKLEKGQIADTLIESDLGYHIVKFEDKQVKNDKYGGENVTLRLRHIVFQKAFEDPDGKNNPNVPAPFMKREEIAKLQVEREKRNKFVEESILRNPIIYRKMLRSKCRRVRQKIVDLRMENRIDAQTNRPTADLTGRHSRTAAEFALERIKVRVASGFQPGLAIGLSLLHSSSGRRSSPTTVRGF